VTIYRPAPIDALAEDFAVHAYRTIKVAFCISCALATGCSASAADQTFRCTNSASGASWELKIDTAKNIVDGFPATISAADAYWRDTMHGGSYELDRSSGRLTFSNASSTGGYTLFYRCQQLK
jgi:hypothetical protein